MQIGAVKAEKTEYTSIEDLRRVTEESPVRCYDEEAGKNDGRH